MRTVRLLWLASIAGLALSGACVYATWRLWAPDLPPPAAVRFPELSISAGQVTLRPAAGTLIGEITESTDELTAYMDFEYVRCLPALRDLQVLLAASELRGGPVYRVYVVLKPDILASYPLLAEMKSRRLIAGFGLATVPGQTVQALARQTELFLWAYNLPVRDSFDELNPDRMLPGMARFIAFKSRTDRRVREGIADAPAPLSANQARTLAADIIAVSRFYGLPLEFFLGIGAMENNYMSAMGDLDHSVWKRRAERGDIILKRHRGRALVRNYSVGVWQITRETLRHAHKLYLADKRDYSSLPERLRPSKDLDLDAKNQDVLTTYAGLLLRDLLDHFGGDIELALAAYNGGIANPNLRYASGVMMVGEYARNLLEHAAAFDQQTPIEPTLASSDAPAQVVQP